jgi:hypothetical protein
VRFITSSRGKAVCFKAANSLITLRSFSMIATHPFETSRKTVLSLWLPLASSTGTTLGSNIIATHPFETARESVLPLWSPAAQVRHSAPISSPHILSRLLISSWVRAPTMIASGTGTTLGSNIIATYPFETARDSVLPLWLPATQAWAAQCLAPNAHVLVFQNCFFFFMACTSTVQKYKFRNSLQTFIYCLQGDP